MSGRGWALIVAGLAVGLVARPAAGQQVRAPAVDSLVVRGLAQAQYNTTSVNTEPDSEWLMRRARIGIRAFVAGWVDGFAEVDLGRGRARLTDAYVRLAFDPRLTVRAGQFKVPFDALQLTSSRTLPVIERDPIPRGSFGLSPSGVVEGLGYSERDIGFEWSGRWPAVTATAGFYNGSGDNAAETDDGKQFAARVEGQLPAGWELAGAWSGLRVSDPPAEIDEAWYNAFEVAVERGGWAEPGWRVLGQLMGGDDYNPDLFGDADATFVALQGLLAYHVPLYQTPYLVGWEPVARVGWTTVDDGALETEDDVFVDLDSVTTTIVTGGVNLFWNEQVVAQIQLDWAAFDVDPDDLVEDGYEYSLRAQVGFAF